MWQRGGDLFLEPQPQSCRLQTQSHKLRPDPKTSFSLLTTAAAAAPLRTRLTLWLATSPLWMLHQKMQMRELGGVLKLSGHRDILPFFFFFYIFLLLMQIIPSTSFNGLFCPFIRAIFSWSFFISKWPVSIVLNLRQQLTSRAHM